MDTLQHNNPPSDAELFRQRIEDLQSRISALAGQDVTDTNAGEFRDMIGLAAALSKDIEARRKEVKQPHIDAGKEIDGTFNPLKQAAERAADPLKAKLQTFLQEQRREAEEAERAARRKAEEEARRAAALADDPLLGDEVQATAKTAEQEAKLVEAETKAKSTIKGSEGFRAATLRKTYKGQVQDAELMVSYYRNHPDVVALCERLANADIRAAKGEAIEIPGVKIVVEETLV